MILTYELSQGNGPHTLGQRLAEPFLACGVGEEVFPQSPQQLITTCASFEQLVPPHG